MFIYLLIVTFAAAAVVSGIVARAFHKPVAKILRRIIADDISLMWQRYLLFALFVVGISSGVRIRDLEKYVTKPTIKNAEVVELTGERWILELYRTIIETLQGLAWALLAFFMVTLVAFVVIRVFEILKDKSKSKEAGLDVSL